MFASPWRFAWVAGAALWLVVLVSGCGPAATTSPGTPSSKSTPTTGKPVKPPENDRG